MIFSIKSEKGQRLEVPDVTVCNTPVDALEYFPFPEDRHEFRILERSEVIYKSENIFPYISPFIIKAIFSSL